MIVVSTQNAATQWELSRAFVTEGMRAVAEFAVVSSLHLKQLVQFNFYFNKISHTKQKGVILCS